MVLEFKHFDSHTGEWIEDPQKQGEIFTEKLDKTLLELYFPDGKFSFAQIDDATTDRELKTNHPEGHVLLLSSKTRMLFGEKEYREKFDRILPDLKDRGAYGSIFLGSCTNTIDKKVRLLVVDDSNGKNGDLLPDDFAFQLTGDCHGKISDELYREAFGDKYHIIQHRLGIPELDRFGKGTIAPTKFEDYPWKDERRADLIIPISSFKGNKLKAGLYEVDIWLGEKERSQQTKAAITPLYGSYPELLKDTLYKLDHSAYKLRENQNNLPALAELYCQRYEEQAKDYEERSREVAGVAASPIDQEKKQIENGAEEEEITDRLDRSTYILMRAAVDSKDPTLLEMPLLAEELKKFVAKQWKNNAIGKDPQIAWDRALIIPSKQLKEGEICISWEKEAETILSTRYPYLNSNGMGVSKNVHLEEMYAPDGNPYEGIILVPDETHERIHQRLDRTIAQECIELGLNVAEIEEEALVKLVEIVDPDREISPEESIEDIAKSLNVDPIVFNRERINETISIINSRGGNITETAPIETTMERQAYDFDGDCNVFANAKLYPNFHKAAVEKYLPENRYAPTVKLAKESFPADWGFEQIALQMSRSPVGLINNHVQNLVALESEIKLIREYGKESDKKNYLAQLTNGLNRASRDRSFPTEYRETVDRIRENSNKPYSHNGFTEITQEYSKLLKDLITEGCQQNQIAVDMFKSATTPDLEKVQNQRLLTYRNVNVIADKKKWGMYSNNSLEAKGFTPQDILADNTNRYWNESNIPTHALEQNSTLFPKIDPTSPNFAKYAQYKLKIAYGKSEYDEIYKLANSYNLKERNEKGAVLRVADDKGRHIDITNLASFKHPEAYKQKPLQVRFIPNRGEYKPIHNSYHQLIAQAKIGDDWQNLGTACEICRQKIDIPVRGIFSAASANLMNPRKHSEEYYNRAKEYSQQFYKSIPSEDLEIATAAAWEIATKKEEGEARQVSRFVLNTFAKEIGARIVDRGMPTIETVNAPKEIKPDYSDLDFTATVNFTVVAPFMDDRQYPTLYRECGEDLEYFAPIMAGSYQPPIGTRLTGKINPLPTATISLKIPNVDKEIVFGNANKSDLADRAFKSDPVEVTLEKDFKEAAWQISYCGRKLGELDKDSVNLLKAKEILREGNFGSVTALTSGKGQAKSTVFQTKSGNNFRIINQPQSSPTFNGETIDVRLSSQPTTEIVAVKFTIDGKKYKAGEFTTHITSKESVNTLKNCGLWQEGVPFEAIATSRNPLYQIEIDRGTIEFPSLDLNLPPVPESTNSLRAKIIKESIANPTLFARDGEIIKLAVDELRYVESVEYLKEKEIPFVEIEPESAALETQKGYRSIQLFYDDLPSDEFKKFLVKFDNPLSPEEYEQKLAETRDKLERQDLAAEVKSSEEREEEKKPLLPFIISPKSYINNLVAQKIGLLAADIVDKRGEKTATGRKLVGKFNTIERNNDILTIKRRDSQEEIFKGTIDFKGNLAIEKFNLSDEEIDRFEQINDRVREPVKTSSLES